MKSLDIVNNRLYWLTKNNASGLLIEKPELQHIKQDLEVLEIIKKKVDFRFMGTCLQVSGENNTKWTFIKEFNLSKEKEEYNKVKQWLDVNDDEN